jgi:hypothetical protein
MAIRALITLACRWAFTIGLTLLASSGYGQVQPTRNLHSWAADSPQTIAMNRTFTSQAILRRDGSIDSTPQLTRVDFSLQGPISGLAVDADFQLNRRDSLMRIILVDEQSREYLVYEAYPLAISEVSPQGGRFSVSAACQESCLLPDVRPTSFRVEHVNASATIRAIHIIPSSKTATMSPIQRDTKRVAIHAAQEKEIAAVLNTQLRAAGLKWQAGTTPLSQMTYEQRTKLFPPPTVPNLQGFEYYKQGVFEVFHDTGRGTAEMLPLASAFVPAFDWRARHRANDPASPYYNGDPTGSGWMTSIKTQLCSDCWAHAANGAVEAGINLFYNQHLDIDLSEQELVSCSGAGSCAYGGNPQQALNYIMNFGIHDDRCFPETGSDDACSLCSFPREQFTLGGYEYIYPSDGDDNIKQEMIAHGPLVFGIISWWHTMVLAGYDTDKTGEPIWILKNSWGPEWGENGYAYMNVPDSDMYLMSYQLPPYTSKLQEYQVECRDADRDGFYNWGIGHMPSSCPADIPREEDCNDADASVALQQADGSCAAVPVKFNACLLYDPARSVNSGATYPLKFYLCDSKGKDVSSSEIVVHATSIFTESGFTGEPVASGNANPKSDFRFDPKLGPSGGYIFNLQTKGLKGGTYGYQFTVTNDPGTHTVLPGFAVKQR